jgi:hypothetical protein
METKYYPITFSIPEEKIIDNTNLIKTKILSDLIPGKLDTYIYPTEKDYYNEYKESFFAITQRKAGWDSLRHYEIIANGCIPYFIGIEECPEKALALLPKGLLINCNLLYHRFKDRKVSDLSEGEIKYYKQLLVKLVNYTKRNLTTRKMAEYILNTVNIPGIKRVLYISYDTDPDYLRCLTLHGFKELFGKDCHDYPKISHIYKNQGIDYSKLYGRGFTYSNLLDHTLHDSQKSITIEEDISNNYYDLIVYGSFTRGMPYYELVSKCYNNKQIILLCGEDVEHYTNWDFVKHFTEIHPVFVREMGN